VKNQNLLNILKRFKIEHGIEDISEKNLKKFIITIRSKQKKSIKYLIKICLSNFALKLNKNEEKGYLFFQNMKISKIQFPIYRKIYKSNKISLHKINFIKGKKLNYLQFAKLKPFFYKTMAIKKKINLSKYSNVINNNFKNLYSFNIGKDLNKDYKKIKKRFKGEVYVSFSHGDLVPWNVISNKKDNLYLYDLEYFSKKRIYLYDFIYWLISPIFIKFYFILNIGINFEFLLTKYLNFKLKQMNILIEKKELRKYFALYLLEQKYFYKLPDNFKNKKIQFSLQNIYKSKKLSDCYSKQLNLILKS
tara:strand:- start:34 stop:948 length:915 start_codon:yes stop_codon:yes gene_type:complete